MLLSLVATLCLITSATAHSTWQALWVSGVDQGSYCVRLPLSNNPMTDITSTNLACNVSPTPSSGLCNVPAGSIVTAEMHQQPATRDCSSQAIGGAHYGPMTIYLASTSNALTAVGSSLSWFKIAEIGLPSDNPDYWGTEVLNDNCGHYSFTVPSDIAPGQYLLRAEVIALHVAGSVGGAQFYVSCYQINVTGGGSSKPAGVSIPGAYAATDPGILIDIYVQLDTYQIPGPTPYGTTSPTVAATAWPTTATWNTALQPSTVPTTSPPGGASTTATAGTTTSTVKTTTGTTTTGTTTSSVKSTTATSTSATATSTAGAVAEYGQCGGTGWTGATACISPYVCTYSSAYYSQCL